MPGLNINTLEITISSTKMIWAIIHPMQLKILSESSGVFGVQSHLEIIEKVKNNNAWTTTTLLLGYSAGCLEHYMESFGTLESSQKSSIGVVYLIIYHQYCRRPTNYLYLLFPKRKKILPLEITLDYYCLITNISINAPICSGLRAHNKYS